MASAAVLPIDRQKEPQQSSQPLLSDEQLQARIEQLKAQLKPNNENLNDLAPELVGELRSLVVIYREEGIVARRTEIRRIRQARLFWQGIQYGWWNPTDNTWRVPGESVEYDDEALQSGPRYQYVTNLFQAFGLSFITVFSQGIPHLVFYPQSSESLVDIATAKAANDVASLIEDNNDILEQLTKIALLLFTDGKLGGYVRFVRDGERFGYKEEPNFSESNVSLGEEAYVCPQCGTKVPSTAAGEGGGQPGEGESSPAPVCPNCGTQLQAADLTGGTMPSVSVTGQRSVANGKELISFIDGLQLNTPVWANEQSEFPWLQWQLETHIAKLKASYPHVRDKIQMGGPIQADDIYARGTRVAVSQGQPLTHPGDALFNLITFSRTWIRKWAFEQIEDKQKRETLKALFPEGCYVAFAGETYCESRSEKMDDHWRVLHAFPGDGQNRPAFGSSLVDVQEQYNTKRNILCENHEFGIPPIYADPQVLDFDALATQTAEPAAHYPARARPGQPLAASFFQPAPATAPPDMIADMQDLIGPIAQFLSGLFPSLYGAGGAEDQKTATGYIKSFQQAMGRVGLTWRRFKEFYAEIMLLSVRCFQQNRQDDTEIPQLGDSGDFESKWIRLDELRGNIICRAETDEQYPRMKSEQRAVAQELMQFAATDPALQQLVSIPENMQWLIEVFGVTDLELPDADSRTKQMRETEALLKGQPAPMPGPNGQMTLQPSVPIEPDLDQHQAHMETIKIWASKDAGMKALASNPMGFANVKAHYMAHKQALDANQQSQNKPPSLSGNIKDMPDSGKIQAYAQSGIKVTPQDLMLEKLKEVMTKQATKPAAPPHPGGTNGPNK